jgi:hypothetical protein
LFSISLKWYQALPAPFIQEHRNITYTLFLNTCLNGHLSLRLLADFPLFISRVQ